MTIRKANNEEKKLIPECNKPLIILKEDCGEIIKELYPCNHCIKCRLRKIKERINKNEKN